MMHGEPHDLDPRGVLLAFEPLDGDLLLGLYVDSLVDHASAFVVQNVIKAFFVEICYRVVTARLDQRFVPFHAAVLFLKEHYDVRRVVDSNNQFVESPVLVVVRFVVWRADNLGAVDKVHV